MGFVKLDSICCCFTIIGNPTEKNGTKDIFSEVNQLSSIKCFSNETLLKIFIHVVLVKNESQRRGKAVTKCVSLDVPGMWGLKNEVFRKKNFRSQAVFFVPEKHG